jgi:hypothetical protein
MAEMTITSVGEREFEVELRDAGDQATNHRVTVPAEMIQEFGLPQDDLENVIRESFEFLLDREPASAIMAEFSLDVIERYFPEYREEMGRKFS